MVLKWSDDTEKTESCKWLSRGSGGPDRTGRKHSTVISSEGSKIVINLCLQTHFLKVSIKNTVFRAINFPRRSVLTGEALVWLCLCTGSCGVRDGNATGEHAMQLAHGSPALYREVINHPELQGLGTPAKPSKMFET